MENRHYLFFFSPCGTLLKLDECLKLVFHGLTSPAAHCLGHGTCVSGVTQSYRTEREFVVWETNSFKYLVN